MTLWSKWADDTLIPNICCRAISKGQIQGSAIHVHSCALPNCLFTIRSSLHLFSCGFLFNTSRLKSPSITSVILFVVVTSLHISWNLWINKVLDEPGARYITIDTDSGWMYVLQRRNFQNPQRNSVSLSNFDHCDVLHIAVLHKNHQLQKSSA